MIELLTEAEQASMKTEDHPSLLVRYYHEITATPIAGVGTEENSFEPAFAYPPLDDQVRAFLAPATATYHVLGDVEGVSLRLLDLRRNSSTQTTKTFASLLLIARAVEHIRRTQQPLLLFSPSSGNKAVALRDAVERALRAGLVEPHELRIVTLTPQATMKKLRRSLLSDDPDLRRLNPACVLHGNETAAVKAIGAEFVELYRGSAQHAGKLWATLRPENYRQADMVRGFTDVEFGTAADPHMRMLHAHSVSSGYGLLGYQTGLDRLSSRGIKVVNPGFMLVQHLATCDMVLHALYRDFGRHNVPDYRLSGGMWVQDLSSHFPQRTWSPHEVLEHTFYTRTPSTAAEMSTLIARHGGTGIVVSLLECINRYAECRQLLARTDVNLPDDPRDLREWSLVMAVCGVLNAIERRLVEEIDGIVIHASGSYGSSDYEVLPQEHLTCVTNARRIADAVYPTVELHRP